MCGKFWEKWINSHKIGQGCSTPLIWIPLHKINHLENGGKTYWNADIHVEMSYDVTSFLEVSNIRIKGALDNFFPLLAQLANNPWNT